MTEGCQQVLHEVARLVFAGHSDAGRQSLQFLETALAPHLSSETASMQTVHITEESAAWLLWSVLRLSLASCASFIECFLVM
jgi:hypothetical protein